MSTELPPVGPERDRLVAEALGCRTWHPYDGCYCKGPGERLWPHDAADEASTDTHAALDALGAWRRGGDFRGVTIVLGYDRTMKDASLDDVSVMLEWPEDEFCLQCAPTLGDAASRAIIEAKRREG